MMNSILEDVRKVITNPVDFYRGMNKTGGFGAPIIFVLVMAVVSAILLVFFSLLGLGSIGGAMAVGFGGIILLPIMATIFSFIGAGILLVIWKLMGSQESFEVSYRCVAYASAIYPITVLAGLIPYRSLVAFSSPFKNFPTASPASSGDISSNFSKLPPTFSNSEAQ